MPTRSLSLAIHSRVQQGSVSSITMLSFSADENQTAVGIITEEGATDFAITSGSADFAINASGVITFKNAPNYEVKRAYDLAVTSSKNKRYSILVNVNDVLSTFTLNTGTVLNLATAI